MNDNIVDKHQSEAFIRDYVCSVCWGHLVRKRQSLEFDVIECGAHGLLHSGFVTKFWVEKQRQNDQSDSVEAKDMLKTIGIIQSPHKDKSEKQLLEELGF